MKKYFHTYLGALRVRNGLDAAVDWICELIKWSSLSVNDVGGPNHVTNTVDVRNFFSSAHFHFSFKIPNGTLGQHGQHGQPHLMNIGQIGVDVLYCFKQEYLC